MADKYIDCTSLNSTDAIATPKQITATITGITAAASAVVTAANDFSANDIVRFTSVAGMTEINGLCGTVSSPSGTGFTVNINSSGFTAYTSGGTATKQMGTTGDVRVLYKDTLTQQQVIDALTRARERLIEVFATS